MQPLAAASRPMLYPVELQAHSVLVGVEGFEPPTSCSQSRRATRLRYTPYELPKGGTDAIFEPGNDTLKKDFGQYCADSTFYSCATRPVLKHCLPVMPPQIRLSPRPRYVERRASFIFSLQFVISTKERSYAQCLKIPHRSFLTSFGMTGQSVNHFWLSLKDAERRSGIGYSFPLTI